MHIIGLDRATIGGDYTYSLCSIYSGNWMQFRCEMLSAPILRRWSGCKIPKLELSPFGPPLSSVPVWDFMLVQLSHGLKCQVSLFNCYIGERRSRKSEREEKNDHFLLLNALNNSICSVPTSCHLEMENYLCLIIFHRSRPTVSRIYLMKYIFKSNNSIGFIPTISRPHRHLSYL